MSNEQGTMNNERWASDRQSLGRNIPKNLSRREGFYYCSEYGIIINVKLYHGSDVTVKKPNLDLSRHNLDFGIGFYATMNREQAIDFAEKVMVRKGQKNQWVSVYDFDMDASLSALSVLQFQSPDRSWLDFVCQNRQSTYAGEQYDLIIGPVANDDVFSTVLLYEQGVLNVDQTLEALKVKKLYSQYVFKTEKALSLLHYENSFDPRSIKGGEV